MENNPQITQMDADSLQRDEQTYAIIGAAMAVHRELGHGFLKATNLQKGLLLNFGSRRLEHKRLVFNLRESAQSADKTKSRED